MSPPRLRVGTVPYVVGRPLDLGLEEESGITLSYEVPAKLVDGLREGRLDVALVSSIELFRRPGYRYLDRLVVAGRGFVSSVQLFLRVPIERVATIALDPASRTSAALLASLLADRAGGPPRFLQVPEGADPRREPADAWLRIGDRALAEYFTASPPPVFNPSQAWCERTGRPFVFAAWIVRPGVAIEAFLPAFERARERGAAAVDGLARGLARERGLPLEGALRYLGNECVYELDSELRGALEAFRDAASAVGACESGLPAVAIPIPKSDVAADPR
jgi:chorismate dehydratase